MLFSGGGPSNKPKKEEKREKKSDRDDKYEVQEAVFTRWANSLFDDPITEIKDIVELSFLQAFTKLITGKTVSISGNRYDDIDVIIHILASDDDDKILALSVPDLCEGNVKQLLILCNSFINMYWRRFAPQEMGDRKISEAIRDWCLEATAGYDDVCVNDFTSSWRDGMALNILLHSYDSNIVDMNAVRDMRGDERLENALSIAKRYFKVPKLILSKEFHSEHLDSKSVLCYLMMLYIAMACYSNSQSSSSKKSSRSSDITRWEERPPETLQPPKESTILELSPTPSSSTNVTVIHKTDPMQQSTETISDVNIIDAETRSRHSSVSSSHKSSRKSSRSKKNENVLKEYERCLEKVLAWLLEADEELNSMEPVNESDVDTVKNQFRDHEQFMLSLTESKDKVGRVLHEGQKLVDELPEEEAKSVNDQLLLVNQRWEDVRCQAMLRQQALQVQLNKLQKEQLQQICGWLSGVEGLIEDRKTLPSDIEQCRQQITEHTVFEEQIEKQQQAIKKLASYMAVVSDESVDDDDYVKIESLLKEVGERWDRICSWTEKRAQNLDGICDLLKEYDKKFTHLSAWLTARQEELVRLRSAHHLTTTEEVEEQKKLIKEMDEALQKEHPSFVELSRLSTELRNRYKLENQEFTEKIIKDFDSVTQRWENIVSRLEEHSQMLNRVKLNPRTVSSQSDSSAQGESSREEGEARLSTEESDEIPRQPAAHSEETINIVELFIEKTKQFEASLKPLAERLKQLKNPTKQQFTVIADEFKTQLAQVEELDALAEKVHQSSMNQAELHAVNENHERAMMFYGKLVNEFTERIKYMQNPNASKDDTAKVELHLTEWIDMAKALWKDITNTPKEARGHRIDAFLIELLELQKKFSDFKAANQNTERFRPLENQLIELQQKARREKEKEKEEREKEQEEQQKEEQDPKKALEWIRNVIVELNRFNLNSGDLKHLKDLEQTLRITSEQLKGKLDVITDEDFVAETEKVVNILKKTTDELNVKINTIENIIHKAVTTEQLADKFERRLADLKRGQFELGVTESESRKLRDELFQHNGQKTKAIKQMDEMLQICQSSNEIEAANGWKTRINKLERQWKTLEKDVEEYISVVAKNYRKHFQDIVAEQEQLSNQLREAMIASGEATDAEELSEHVDNMEYLLEKLTKTGTEEVDPFQQYNLTNDTYVQREIERVNVQRKHIIDLAKERCARLQEAISKCEMFEKDLCNFQSWCQHMNHILNTRLSQDINALDVPHEYKQMNTEFSEYDVLLRSLGEFIEESKSHWSSSDRLKLQKNHASAQLEELKGRFNLFKKPVQFEKSLESIEKMLQNVEESLDDLAGVKAENCEYCQIHISQTMKQVASCQETLIDLENKKDALVQEGIFDEEQAIIADQRLETALRKTQALDARAVNDMERLQQSAQLVKKYEAEKSNISKNIREIEDKAVKAPDDIRKSLEDAVAGIKKALELKAVLHQNAVRLSDSELDEYDRKVQILRNKYGSLLTSDSECADHLKTVVISLERSVNMLERSGDKKQMQQVREKLVNINRQLLNSGDEIRKELGPKVAEINSRISELERESRSISRTAKSLKETSSELHEPVLPPTTDLNSDNFEECVFEFLRSSKSLSSYLNFKTFPVEDTAKWVQRVKVASQVSASNEEYRERLVKFGREWAEKGRMELSDQQILDYLDESDALTTKNSEQIQSENELLNAFETLEEMTNNCLTSIKQNIEEIHKLDLTDQLNVLKAQDELEAVNERITESLIAIDKFSQNAPGREKIFQILYDKISELQVEVEYANARVRQALTDLLTTTEQVSDKEQDFKKKPVHPDGVSMSSGAGLSLAMDVQETEGEEYFSDAARNQNKIGDVFNDLDTFEDFFDRDESLPFEGIDEKDQYLNTIEQRLAEDKKVIKQMQMNMDVNEYEHTMGRFKALSQNLLTRRDNMRNNRSTIDNLFSFFSQAEEDVFKLDNIIRKADKNKSKDHSVDMEDWEAGQLETENLIPSLAVHIQQCENRYHNLKDKLSASLQNEFGTRLANLNDDFNLLRHAVEKNRMILEDKLADERYLLKNMNKFSNWCDEIEKFLNKQESFLDPLGLDASYELMKHRQTEVDEKILAFRSIEMLKDRFVALGDVDTEVKHRIRREITQLAKRISDLQLAMTKQTKELADLKEISDEFWTEVSKINNWVQDADVQVSNVEKAHLYKPMLFNLKKMIAESSDLKLQTQLMQRQVAEELLELKAPNEIHHQSGKTVDTVAKNFNNVIERARELLEGTLKEEQVEKLEFAPELELEQLESPPRNYNGRDDSTVEYGTLTNRDDSLPPASMKDSGSKSRAETEEFHDALDRPLAEAFDHLNNSTILDAKFNPEEKQRQEKCIQINGRLQEIERSISTTVNITDQSQIRQLISDNQNFLNEIGIHKVELQRILNQTEEQLISSRAIQCLYDLEKILESCKKRKLELTEMLHQTRLWEQLRSELELWLTEGNEKLMATERVNEMDEVTLEAELKSVNDITGTIDNMKAQMEQLNLRSNEMIDKFIYDDNHTLSQLTSKLNTQWTKFNESLCIRRAVLEASLRSRNDIHTTLTQLDGWLNKQLGILKQLDADTENKQRLKDTSKRRDWMGQERESNAEIEAHRQVITSVRDMCKNLLNVLEADNERQTLQNKLEAVEAKWVQINELDSIVRERIQNAQDECEKLTKDLSELLHWTDMQISTILHDQPVGGDLTTVQQQSDTIRKIERQFDSKNREVSDCIQLSHSYLMQHDLRPMIHRGSAFDSSKEMEKSDAQLEERRIGVQILADSEKLKSSYDALKQHLSAWQRVVSTAHRELQELDTAIAESLLAIGTIENEMDGMKLVEDLRLEELKEAKIEHAILKKRVQDTAVKVDDVNDCTGQIAAQNIVLSPHMEMQIQTVNARYEKLSKEVGIRGAALERAFTDFGPSSEHFLSESVQPPWQRSISALNQMPYYVDHVTENTQWDHPSMVDIFEKLCTFNQVKFSAYRTAMKLRALQKHMCLDLIDLPSLDQALHKYRNAPLDEKISIEDVVMTLVPLFESAHQKYPQLLRNVPLAVDLALNLLLNIYDPCRDGKLRTVSFAIAMVVLCNATLESKYKFLFSLITRDEGVDHKQLGLLFYDLIHITKLLGEAAVFGGSNIEPSVRSCFEYSKYPAKLSVDQYLSWLKKEPQSIVWLPVMHRLASSEFAKHQAKCNACKMFPIVGMRYRCLRCFNYDICQNCFFSQRTSKSHKLTHPMQEYCTPTKSKDDVRDFTLMVKNKMRRSRSKRGYLPVDTVDEGLPLENNQNVPQNPATETIHQRVQVFSQRLLKRQQESISAVNVQKALQIKEEAKVEIKSTSKQPLQSKLHKSATDGPGMRRDVNEIKSPSQLIKQVEQMHKEEMDQLLQKLQYENSELRQAVERKRHLGSTPNLEGMRQSGPQSGYPLSARHTAQPGIYASTQTMPHGTSIGISQPHPFAPHRIVSQPTLFSEDNRRHYGRSASSLPRGYSEIENFTTDQRRLLDAKSIRIHEHQLEERSRALEEQNKQLQIQLDRLQRVVDKQTPSEFPRPVDTSHIRQEFGHRKPEFPDFGMYGVSSTDEDDTPGGIEALKMRRNRMDSLMNTMNELNRAMEYFVGSMLHEEQNLSDQYSVNMPQDG
uniref:Dystrophin n=1 Tax=Bursaphelenchus xylophilus TaxID=6326 RepID=A0A1I7SAC8_BURXY